MSATSGPTTDQALLFAACFKRGHIGPSGCLRVGPRQGAMVGPNGAVVATLAATNAVVRLERRPGHARPQTEPTWRKERKCPRS